MKETVIQPRKAVLGRVLHRVVQHTSLSKTKHCSRHTQSLILIGLRSLYLYLHSIKVLDAEMKCLNPHSSREQNVSGLKKMSKMVDRAQGKLLAL